MTPKRIPALILGTNCSNSFPNRSMQTVGSRTILEHLVRRLTLAEGVGPIMLGTSVEILDDDLVELGKSLGIAVTRGPLTEVIERIAMAFDFFSTDDLVITRGDTPLIDVQGCEQLVAAHLDSKAELTFNEHIEGYPYGMGALVVSQHAIDKVWADRRQGLYSQNCAMFFRLHRNRLVSQAVDFPNPDQSLRFVVENPADLEFTKEIVSLAGEESGAHEILTLVRKHSYLKRINHSPNNAREISSEKILLFPDKLESLVDASHDSTYPISVELSLTNACNLSCKWCSDQSLRKGRPGVLPWATYEGLLDDLSSHGTRGLVIEGGGEPTVYPEFKEAISEALNRQLAVGLITNGVLFDYADLLPRLEWVRVSLDADCPQTFLEWKGKDMFYTVLENIRAMCSVKGDCTVGIGYVVTKHNIEFLEEITMLLGDTGVDYLYLRPVIDHEEISAATDLNFLKKYETGHFSVMIHAMEENAIEGNDGLPCIAHSLSCVISADGSVFICGRLNAHEWWEPIGNVNETSFHDIWNGEKRRKQNLALRDPVNCQKWCPACRLTKYNVLLDRLSQVKTRNFI